MLLHMKQLLNEPLQL